MRPRGARRKEADRIFKKAPGSDPRRGDTDACASAGKGRRTEQSADSPNAGGYGGAGEVQRGAGQGGGRRGGRRPFPELAGQGGAVGRQDAKGHGRSVGGDHAAGG